MSHQICGTIEFLGTSAEITLHSMNLCRKASKGVGELCLTVHDEIGLLCPEKKADEASKILQECMRQGMVDVLPGAAAYSIAKVKIGKTWGECK